MTPFLDILYQLSHETGLQLYPDNHHACKLVVGEHITVQLEMDISQEHLLLGSVIYEIPLGAFRENVLKHALVANSGDYPLYGYLCYIQKLNALALYDALSLKNLTGISLSNHIILFAQKAELWREALSSNRPGPNTLKPQGGKPPPFLGIKL
ncbi:MAG: CesT family type III secretion system chaperone [Chlamydiota bacterium]